MLGLRVLESELPSPLYQVLVCEIVVLSQRCQFLDYIRGKLAHKDPYTTSIRDMYMRLLKL